MQVIWPKFLNALGSTISDSTPAVKQQCPLHPDRSPALEVTEYPETKHCSFRCIDPGCRFEGDAVALTAAVKRLSIPATLELFKTGGPLAHTLESPLTDSDILAYTERQNTRLRLATYMAQCQQALRAMPELSKLRAGLSHANVQFLPRELGLLARHDVPPAFAEFNKTKYQRGQYIVYPYTFNDEITHVRVQNTEPGPQPIVPAIVTRQDIGVFMEPNIERDTQELFVTFNPRIAAILYGEFAAESNKRPPIVAIAGFPLPDRARNLKTITLLSTTDAPLTLTEALGCLLTSRLISGREQNPTLRVYSSRETTQTLTADHLRQCLIQPGQCCPLPVWLITEMDKLVQQDSTEQLFKALNVTPLTADLRLTLIKTAETMASSATLQQLLRTFGANATDRYVLANGRAFRRSRSGLRSVNHDGTEDVLSNFDLEVDHRIQGPDGTEIFVCRIMVDDPRTLPLTLKLPETTFVKPATLQRAIRQGFTERNEAPYIACYAVPNIYWADVMARLGEHCELLRMITQLGPNDAREIHFPHVTLRLAERVAAPQQQLYTLPEPVQQQYGGLQVSAPQVEPLEPFRQLFRHVDNPYVGGMVAGLTQLVYQMTAGMALGGNLELMVPRHMLFVEPETGLWQPIFGQLTYLLSGQENLRRLNRPALAAAIQNRALGALPWFGHIPDIRPAALEELLTNSPISLVAIINNITASSAAANDHTVYVTPANMAPHRGVLSSPDLLELQHALPEFLLATASHFEHDTTCRFTTTPIQTTYEALCALLGVPPMHEFGELVRAHYTDTNGADLDYFFDMLHRLYMHGTRLHSRLRISHRMPKYPIAAAVRGFNAHVLEDVVVISKATVDLVNRQLRSTSEPHFRIADLTLEFIEHQYLVELPPDFKVDPNRCWCVSRQLWEDKVVKAPIVLMPVTTSQPIQLVNIG